MEKKAAPKKKAAKAAKKTAGRPGASRVATPAQLRKRRTDAAKRAEVQPASAPAASAPPKAMRPVDFDVRKARLEKVIEGITEKTTKGELKRKINKAWHVRGE